MNQLWKIPKVTLISLLISLLWVLALWGIFHLWLISNAKKVLSEIVREQSHGKYHLQLDKIRYNYLKLRLEVQQPVLTSLVTSQEGGFEMHAQRISIQLEKIWPLMTLMPPFPELLIRVWADRPSESAKVRTNAPKKAVIGLTSFIRQLH